MAKDEGSWDKLVKKRALWLQSFWFVRGVMGTMALVALIPQVTELEQIEVPRALYALIIGWNDEMGWVGRMVGGLPYIPDIPAAIVSASLFLVSIILPIIVGLYRYRPPESMGNYAISILVCLLISVGFTALYVSLAVYQQPDWALVVYQTWLLDLDPDSIELLVASRSTRVVEWVVYAVAFLACVYVAMEHVRGFKVGLIFTLGIIGYNIGTTQFSDAVNAIVCAELDIPPTDCTPEDT